MTRPVAAPATCDIVMNQLAVMFAARLRPERAAAV
jgi:hypothetical protein